MIKKVLFVATVTKHINSFHIPYLKLFKENGYQVEVASFGNEDIEYCDKHYNIQFTRTPFSKENIEAYKKLKSIINSNHYDLIHCHTPVGGALTRLAARKARRIYGTRVFYTAHGFHFFKGAPLLNWIVYYPIEKWLSRYTDCLITINNEDYKIANKKFKARQIELVHGVGIDMNKFNIPKNLEEIRTKRKELGIENDDFIILQVGELNKNKNQIMLIEAMRNIVKENPKIKALIAGTGNLETFYKEKINEYGLEKHVFMLGYRKDIPDLLQISNCLVSLSYREGLPVNVMEALFADKIIIATDIRGNRDLVNNENGYLIKINDIDSLKLAIVDIFNNNNKKVNKDFIEQFEKNEIEKKMKEIYSF